jgi:carbamoylphosphate synthase small subunit
MGMVLTIRKPKINLAQMRTVRRNRTLVTKIREAGKIHTRLVTLHNHKHHRNKSKSKFNANSMGKNLRHFVKKTFKYFA